MPDVNNNIESQQEYFGKADKKINWTEIYNECVIDEAIAENKVKQLEAQIEKMKSDVVRCFGDEYNVLVAKLLEEWKLKE